MAAEKLTVLLAITVPAECARESQALVQKAIELALMRLSDSQTGIYMMNALYRLGETGGTPDPIPSLRTGGRLANAETVTAPLLEAPKFGADSVRSEGKSPIPPLPSSLPFSPPPSGT